MLVFYSASALLAMPTAVPARKICLSVCLPVHTPVTFRCFVQTNEDAITRFHNNWNYELFKVQNTVNKKCGFCQPDLPSFQELCDTADEQLFDKILHNKHHPLHYILPPPSSASQCYNLRSRPHTQLLPQHRGHLIDSNFITRILYKNIYCRYHETIHTYAEPRTNCYYTSSFIIVNHLGFCQAWSINEYVTLCYAWRRRDGPGRVKNALGWVEVGQSSNKCTKCKTDEDRKIDW